MKMRVCQQIFVLVVYFLNDVSPGLLTDEYCIWEAFQPRCSQNEIIVINEAVYGRRKLGRCLMDEGTPSDNFLEDPKFLGCFVDVRHILEPFCAGKSECDVTVAKLKTETPCHKWCKLYLEVDYKCIQVVRGNRHCSISVGTDVQHLSAQSNSNDGKCGTKIHPWTAEVLTGQRIKFSLMSFLANSNYSKQLIYLQQGSVDKSNDCNSVGSIMDKNSKKKITVCIGKDTFLNRSTQMITDSNSAEITLNSGVSNSGLILAVEATGCSDLIPPADAWLKRTENEATIGCYSTRLRWQLKCLGQRWIGVIGNCSQGHPAIRDETGITSIKESSKEAGSQAVVPIVAIAMTGFVICFLIICIGVVFINRYYAINKTKMMKHMTNEIPKHEYNNGSLHYSSAKNFPNGIIQDNSGLLSLPEYQDSAHYFELDQSLVSKDADPNKT